MIFRHWGVLIFASGLAIGCIQVFLISAPWEVIVSDADNYLKRAQTIAENRPLITGDTFFPLGISYIFSIFFKVFGSTYTYPAIAIYQIIALATCHTLVYFTTRELFRDVIIARLASLLSLVYWPITAQLSFYMSEPSFMLMLLAGQYCMVKSFNTGSVFTALIAGLLIGIASIIKFQGVIVLIAGVMIAIYMPGRKILLATIVTCTSVLLLHSHHIATIRGHSGFETPANGAFNLYLGQSARIAVGSSNLQGQIAIFYNNNSFMNKGLYEIELHSTSIMNQAFYLEKVRQLVQENPYRQLMRTLQSATELHALTPHWPLREVKSFVPVELAYKYLAIPGAYFPAFLAIFIALGQPTLRIPVALLWLTLIGITAASGLSMGQPRYLIPFLPNLFMLASLGLVCLGASLRNYLPARLTT